MIKNLGIALGAAAAVMFLGAAPAHAEPAPTAGHGSVAGLVGYGFKDGMNLGLGVRGGYTLPMNLYLGGTFVYHLGKTEGPQSLKSYYLGFEGGYDLAAGPVVIRPYLGLGAHTVTGTMDAIPGITTEPISSSDTAFALWPGATVLYPLGSAFLGADARYVIRDQLNTFSLFATGGVQF